VTVARDLLTVIGEELLLLERRITEDATLRAWDA
jgi:hypothetical protein